MHYPGYMRDNFVSWIDDGLPTIATVERKYEEVEVPAEEMLLELVKCSDILPGIYLADIADYLGVDRERAPATYGKAARRLLAVGVSAH